MKKLSGTKQNPVRYGQFGITDTRTWMVYRSAAVADPAWAGGDAKVCQATDHELSMAGAAPFPSVAPDFHRLMPRREDMLPSTVLPWRIVSPGDIELVCVYRAPSTEQERAKVAWIDAALLENIARTLDVPVGALELSLDAHNPSERPLGIRVGGYEGWSGCMMPFQVKDTTPLAEALIATETDAVIRKGGKA